MPLSLMILLFVWTAASTGCQAGRAESQYCQVRAEWGRAWAVFVNEEEGEWRKGCTRRDPGRISVFLTCCILHSSNSWSSWWSRAHSTAWGMFYSDAFFLLWPQTGPLSAHPQPPATTRSSSVSSITGLMAPTSHFVLVKDPFSSVLTWALWVQKTQRLCYRERRTSRHTPLLPVEYMVEIKTSY